MQDMDLKYRAGPSKREVVEASRPAQQIKMKLKEKTRKPSGRKPKNTARPGQYTNWGAPFLWSCILAAQRKVGWSPQTIVNELHRVNHDVFQHLSRSTVGGWIELVQGFHQWKPHILQKRSENGNMPGHSNGGRRGVLVRTSK
jgi:hypothetical protein